jgi:hypothetical protein
MLISEENTVLRQIAQRAQAMYARNEIKIGWEYIMMELRIVHREICELRLKELLDSSDSNFMHDITGIHKHLDMLDGRFRDGWSPRYGR